MRLEPSEESMYRRMGFKGSFSDTDSSYGAYGLPGLFFMASPSKYLIGIVAIIAGAVGLGTSLGGYLWLKQRIMPLSGCFFGKYEAIAFVTVQPYKDSQYESCRIYYKEVETLVKTKMERDLYQNFAVRREHDSGEPEKQENDVYQSVRIFQGGDRKNI